jgi:hypothetical protein
LSSRPRRVSCRALMLPTKPSRPSMKLVRLTRAVKPIRVSRMAIAPPRPWLAPSGWWVGRLVMLKIYCSTLQGFY